MLADAARQPVSRSASPSRVLLRRLRVHKAESTGRRVQTTTPTIPEYVRLQCGRDPGLIHRTHRGSHRRRRGDGGGLGDGLLHRTQLAGLDLAPHLLGSGFGGGGDIGAVANLLWCERPSTLPGTVGPREGVHVG
jgi:hypothetical protein